MTTKSRHTANDFNPKADLFVTWEDLSTQGTALDDNFASLQLSSTPSGDLNSSPQAEFDTLSSPPSVRRRSSKADTAAFFRYWNLCSGVVERVPLQF